MPSFEGKYSSHGVADIHAYIIRISKRPMRGIVRNRFEKISLKAFL
jgi:hypothetical protein